jgi:hypothetical protein
MGLPTNNCKTTTDLGQALRALKAAALAFGKVSLGAA